MTAAQRLGPDQLQGALDGAQAVVLLHGGRSNVVAVVDPQAAAVMEGHGVVLAQMMPAHPGAVRLATVASATLG